MSVILHCSGFRVGRERIKQLAEKVLSIKKVKQDVEIVFVDEAKIRELNRRYLGREGTTDVLAFPFSSDNFVLPRKARPLLGQVFICYPQAIKQAKRLGHSKEKELAVLVVHGLLHLLGFEDKTEEGRKAMREEEERLLSLAGGHQAPQGRKAIP